MIENLTKIKKKDVVNSVEKNEPYMKITVRILLFTDFYLGIEEFRWIT